MKTIYNAVMDRLKQQVPALKWIDLDTGQLSMANPPVAFPCALVGIKYPRCKTITDTEQEVEARISIRFAWNNPIRTAAQTDDEARAASMAVYDTIADIYAALQGFGTDNFDSLTRVNQGEESNRKGLFVYKLEFAAIFVNVTAEG